MCTTAARRALECAGLGPDDLQLVICATTTPDQPVPCTGCLIQQRLGATRAGAFDLNSACTGFLTALVVGSQFVRGGTCERVLVVAGETLSRFLDWRDRRTCVLFGDGAAAVVLEATTQDAGVVSTVLGSQGDVNGLLAIEAGGCARPASAETVARGEHFIRMRGNELFRLAVRGMTSAATEALARAGLTIRDVRKVIPHQANARIITATQAALGVPADRVFVNVDRYGNTGSTSVPMALAELLAAEPVCAGDNLLLVSFGGGLTWAAAVVRWADIAALHQARPGARTTLPHAA
jgi:3-oxoacyl-[acyl-carrier-protein] synthase-3